jgi:excisionase family DNA binding protein
MTQDTSFLTVGQATERLNAAGLPIRRDTVQRWCRDAKIPAVTLPGGHYRIRVEDVDALLTAQPTEAGAA